MFQDSLNSLYSGESNLTDPVDLPLDEFERESQCFKDYIFHVTYATATGFGFQTFNPNPWYKAPGTTNTTVTLNDKTGNSVGKGKAGTRQDVAACVDQTSVEVENDVVSPGRVPVTEHEVHAEFAPATAFLVSDHLCKVLVEDLTARRYVLEGCDLEIGFREAVWMLHGKLFCSFEKWADTAVNLPKRPQGDENILKSNNHLDDEVTRMLLVELSVLLLIYTEGANLRHLPDGLSLLYWIHRTSGVFRAIAESLSTLSHFVDQFGQGTEPLAQTVLKVRNTCAVDIALATRQLAAKPNLATMTPGEKRDAAYDLLEHIDEDMRFMAATMVVSGDGDFFTTCVTQPVFHFLAYTEDVLGGSGVETSVRVSYDDCNDAFCNRDTIDYMLKRLGVQDLRSENNALAALVRIGLMRDSTCFDAMRAATWWEQVVFRHKVFVERRGWFHVYRNYYPAFLMNALVFHAATAFTFVGFHFNRLNICGAGRQRNCFDLTTVVWSSLVLTHCLMVSIRDWAGWFLSRQPAQAPTLAEHLAKKPNEDLRTPHIPSSLASVSATSPDLPAALALAEGVKPPAKQPALGFIPLGGLPSFVVLLVLSIIFFGQFQATAFGVGMHGLWLALVSCYLVALVGSFFFTQGMGYTKLLVTVSNIPQLFRNLRASYRYERALMPGILTVGWESWSRNTLTWMMALVIMCMALYLANYTLNSWVAGWLLKDYRVGPQHKPFYFLGIINTGLPQPNKQFVATAGIMMVQLMGSTPLQMFIFFLIGSQALSWLIGKHHGYGGAQTWRQFCSHFHTLPYRLYSKCMPKPPVELGAKESAEPSRNEQRHMFCCVWNHIIDDLYTRYQLTLDEARRLSYTTISVRPSADEEDNSRTTTPRNPDAPQSPQLLPAGSFSLLSKLQLPGIFPPAGIVGPALTSQLVAPRKSVWARTRKGDAKYQSMNYLCLDEVVSEDSPALNVVKLLLWCMHKLGMVNSADAMMLWQAMEVNTEDVTYNTSMAAVCRAGLRWMHSVVRFYHLPSTQGALHTSNLSPASRTAHPSSEAGVLLIAATQDYLQAVVSYLGVKMVPAVPTCNEWLSGMCAAPGGTKSLENLPERAGALQGLASALKKQHDNMDNDPSATSEFLTRCHRTLSDSKDTLAACHYIADLYMCATHEACRPQNEEAEHSLRLFMKTMFHPKLGSRPPCPVLTMPSLNTLVPWYNEDVLHVLDADVAACDMGAPAPPPVSKWPRTRDSAKVWLDLLTEVEQGVSQVSYLQSMFKSEWKNFQDRVAAATGVPADRVTVQAFQPGGELAHLEWELLIWATGRSQYLARQVKGLNCYFNAIRLLLFLENPPSPSVQQEDYVAWLEKQACKKYLAVIAAQTLGEKLVPTAKTTAREMWNAKSFVALLNMYPFLRAVVLQSEMQGSMKLQYSIMVRGVRSAGQSSKPPPNFEGGILNEWLSPNIQLPDKPVASYSVQDISVQYSLRLPVNLFSKRGIVIGQGKPENHNNAMPFVLTELVQGNDMNMDNVLSEAVKLRSLLSEFIDHDRIQAMFPLEYGNAMQGLYAAQKKKRKKDEQPLSPGVNPAEPFPGYRQSMIQSHRMSGAAPLRMTAENVAKRITGANEGPQLAILGITAWICTASNNTLAFINALFELLFTFNINRQMYYSSRVRYHYGYGDVWNKFWTMTTTGLSRPVRNLHVVEDLTVGVRVAHKGGLIKLRDYIMTGKGRETNLVGLYGYHRKISAGVMEATLGRDFFLLHLSQDGLRQITSFLFICSCFVSMHMVYTALWMRPWLELLLSLLKIPVTESSFQTLPKGFTMLPSWLPQQSSKEAWDMFLFVFWIVGMVPLLYGGELVLQHGWRHAFAVMFRMLRAGFPIFNLILLKIWEVYSVYGAHHMATAYVATGRGFGLHHVPFVQQYIMFGKGFWYYCSFMMSLVILSTIHAPAGLQPVGVFSIMNKLYAPIIMVIFFFVGPFWLSPLGFSFRKVSADLWEWLCWMHGKKEPISGTTWQSWHDGFMVSFHNIGSKVQDFYWRWFLNLVGLLLRNTVICWFCVQFLFETGTTTKDAGFFTRAFIQPALGKLEPTSTDLALNLTYRTIICWSWIGGMLLIGAITKFTLSAGKKEGTHIMRMCVTLAGTVGCIWAFCVCFQPWLGRQVYGPGSANFFVLLCGNMFAAQVMVHLLTVIRWEPVLWLVTQLIWMVDLGIGAMVQVFLLVVSALPLLQWVQNQCMWDNCGYSAPVY